MEMRSNANTRAEKHAQRCPCFPQRAEAHCAHTTSATHAEWRKRILMTISQPNEHNASSTQSHDGVGAGDHDQPYRFGWRPSVGVPFPFNTRQYARLLILRSRYHARGPAEAQAA